MTMKSARETICLSAALLAFSMFAVVPQAGAHEHYGAHLAQAADEAEGQGDAVDADQETLQAVDEAMESMSEQEIAQELGIADGSGEVNPRVVRRSLRNVLHKSQQKHDRILVDRFLLWVSILFALISLLLFLSQPPAGKKRSAAD